LGGNDITTASHGVENMTATATMEVTENIFQEKYATDFYHSNSIL